MKKGGKRIQEQKSKTFRRKTLTIEYAPQPVAGAAAITTILTVGQLNK